MKTFVVIATLGLALLPGAQVTAFVAPAAVRTVMGSAPIIQQSNNPPTPDLMVSKSIQPTAAVAITSRSSLQALPVALTALPLSQKIVLSCLLPTCLGFWRSEYGVSYAYGSATALTSYFIYQALLATSKTAPQLATWHAGALMFYGVRLCLFLLYRELCTNRMKESVKRIEAKATERGSRLKRLPFVLSCAGLYFGLCAPLLITSQLSAASLASNTNKWVVTAMKALVSLTWGGFIVAALGDFNKSIVKAIKGEDHLVTGGIYQFCRHPNYTGEFVGWTSNGLLAILAAAVVATTGKTSIIPVPKLVGYVAASVVGALGLDFVLVQATGGLEKRQKETYGDSDVYQKWVETSWAGIETPAEVEAVLEPLLEPHVHPEIEVVDTPDDGGSGI